MDGGRQATADLLVAHPELTALSCYNDLVAVGALHACVDLGRRVPVTSADELGRLADSINRMAADLARLEAARREFIAKISHDLRTPLTAIKGFVINLQDTAPDRSPWRRRPREAPNVRRRPGRTGGLAARSRAS